MEVCPLTAIPAGTFWVGGKFYGLSLFSTGDELNDSEKSTKHIRMVIKCSSFACCTSPLTASAMMQLDLTIR